MNNDIFSEIKTEDLTEELCLIEEVCGIVAVQSLMKHYSGMSFYIPKISRLDRFIQKYIKENSSKTFKQIANELSVSEQFIRNSYNKNRNNNKKSTKNINNL